MVEDAYYEGVNVEFLFEGDKPDFGDLIQICGGSHPHSSPQGLFDFTVLTELGFQQVDDYFGIPSNGNSGDDIVVWLFPLKDGEEAFHNSGPFDGLRLSYNILRNPTSSQPLFERAINEMAKVTSRSPQYVTRCIDLGSPPDLAPLKADIEKIVKYWRDQGIEPGSNDAMEVDF